MLLSKLLKINQLEIYLIQITKKYERNIYTENYLPLVFIEIRMLLDHICSKRCCHFGKLSFMKPEWLLKSSIPH